MEDETAGEDTVIGISGIRGEMKGGGTLAMERTFDSNAGEVMGLSTA
jgi:hypothetical protein